MSYLLETVYLLIGIQIGARMFFWSRNISKIKEDFIIPLIFVPLIWPVVIIMTFFDDVANKALFHWEE